MVIFGGCDDEGGEVSEVKLELLWIVGGGTLLREKGDMIHKHTDLSLKNAF